MKIGDLKPKEKPGPPELGEPQFGDIEHICESCGRWGLLWWNGDCWVCKRCRKDPLKQTELPY